MNSFGSDFPEITSPPERLWIEHDYIMQIHADGYPIEVEPGKEGFYTGGNPVPPYTEYIRADLVAAMIAAAVTA